MISDDPKEDLHPGDLIFPQKVGGIGFVITLTFQRIREWWQKRKKDAREGVPDQK